MRWSRRVSQPHMLIPGRSDRSLVAIAEATESPAEDALLRGHQAIQSRHGRQRQPCLLPVMQGDIERADSRH